MLVIGAELATLLHRGDSWQRCGKIVFVDLTCLVLDAAGAGGKTIGSQGAADKQGKKGQPETSFVECLATLNVPSSCFLIFSIVKHAPHILTIPQLKALGSGQGN